MPRPNCEEVLLVSCGQLGTPESFKRKPSFVRKLNHFERGRIQSLCRVPLIGHEMFVVWRPTPSWSAAVEQIKYVLVTPAKNEEKFIEQTIESVLSQTILPET